MKLFWIVLLILLFALQYRIWVGEGSYAEIWVLKQNMTQQARQNQQLNDQNEVLKAEVNDLRQGLDAIEERARDELGMIRENEVFYQLIDVPANSRDAE